MSGPESSSYDNPVVVRFGPDCWRGAGERRNEKNLLLLTSPGMTRRGVAARVRDGWGGGAEKTLCDRVRPNPEIAALESLAAELRTRQFDGIIALGGGSVIDTAKVLSVLLASDAVGLDTILRDDAALPVDTLIPVFAVPTTAGSGSEMTPFATVWDGVAAKKRSLASPRLYPRGAYVDPELTAGLPHDVAVATGLDALSQGLESIWSLRANDVSRGFATRSVQLALGALPGFAGGRALDAGRRSDLMRASLLAGLAISHTRTALAHSMSYPLTARFGLPHGLACGFALPAVLAFTAPADDGRLEQLAIATACGSTAGLRDRLIALIESLGVDELLRRHGIDAQRLAQAAPEMIHAGRADNHLRPATLDDVRGILRAVGEYLPSCRADVVSHG